MNMISSGMSYPVASSCLKEYVDRSFQNDLFREGKYKKNYNGFVCEILDLRDLITT